MLYDTNKSSVSGGLAVLILSGTMCTDLLVP